MNNKLPKSIIDKIKKGISVILIGKTNSGKTYFIKNKLIPLLRKFYKVTYFKDGNHIKSTDADVIIFDEVELFFDKDRLESGGERFSKDYINQVDRWQKSYKQFKQPSVYIVSRNEVKNIKYIQKFYKKAEWDNRKLIVIIFV